MLKINIRSLQPKDTRALAFTLQRIHRQLTGEDITDKVMIEQCLQEVKEQEDADFISQVVQDLHGIPDTDPGFESITQRLAEQETALNKTAGKPRHEVPLDETP